jgi:hypothetical protein
VRLPDGSRVIYGAANSSAHLTGAQRRELEGLGVKVSQMTGKKTHAEINIINDLPSGAQVKRWGISSGQYQTNQPCSTCLPFVQQAGGNLE